MIILIGRIVQEALDEYRKYRLDQSQNLERFKVFDRRTGQFRSEPAKSIREGDIVKIANQRVPADIVIFRSKCGVGKGLTRSRSSGIVYVRTDQLDGETDLKSRQEPSVFQGIELGQMDSFEIIFNTRKNKLTEFEAKICKVPGDAGQDPVIREPVPLNRGKGEGPLDDRPARESHTQAQAHGLGRLRHSQRRGGRTRHRCWSQLARSDQLGAVQAAQAHPDRPPHQRHRLGGLRLDGDDVGVQHRAAQSRWALADQCSEVG